jgi:hypothetical protein
VHTYLQAGWFHVNLTVCNDAGCFWYNQSNYIYTLASSTPTPTETPRYYIRIGGGSGGSTQGSSVGTQEGAEKGSGENKDSGSTGTLSESGTSQSNGAQGSQGTGNTAGQESGMPNPEQSQPTSVTGILAWIQALGDIGTIAGALLESLVNQLRHLLGI